MERIIRHEKCVEDHVYARATIIPYSCEIQYVHFTLRLVQRYDSAILVDEETGDEMDLH